MGHPERTKRGARLATVVPSCFLQRGKELAERHLLSLTDDLGCFPYPCPW